MTWALARGLSLSLVATTSLIPGASLADCPVLLHASGAGHALPITMDMSVKPAQATPVVLTFDHDQNSYKLLDPATADDKPEPDSWIIPPSKTKRIQIAPSRNGANPGVIGLDVKVSGIELPGGCHTALDANWAINTGIGRVARFHVRGEGFSCDDDCDSAGSSLPITVHGHTRFTVSLLGTDKGSFYLDAPVTIRATSADADISGDGGRTWANSRASAPLGNLIGPGNPHASFDIVPGWNSTGTIMIDASVDGSTPVMKAELTYRTVAPWWIFLPACLAGAMAYVLFDVLIAVGGDLRKFWAEFSKNGYAKPILGIAAGLLGWVLKQTNLVDLKITSSDTLGYLVLGASFAAIGIEGLFKVFQRNAPPPPPPAPVPAPPPPTDVPTK